jgi:hypothetical protein
VHHFFWHCSSNLCWAPARAGVLIL